MTPMNRRDFIASGIATGVYSSARASSKGSGVDFTPLRERSGTEVHGAASPAPSWLENEPMVLAGGWDMSPIFQLRRGGAPVDFDQIYDRHNQESTVRKLKEAGVTLAIIPFFKGFGLVAERDHMAHSRILAKRLKAAGIRVGLYVGATIAYETFLSEKPEAREWFAPDYEGKPVYYFDQTFRRMVYFMHPGYREYIQRVIRFGVEQYDPDSFHFDNSALMAQVRIMQHPMAIQDFRNYLKAKYTAPELTKRFGFADVRNMECPQPVKPPVLIKDPLFQEFAEFRCDLLAAYFKEMTSLIRSLNPKIAVDNNPHRGISGLNTIWEEGVSYPKLTPQIDVMWSEEGDYAGVSPDGILVSKIRTLKESAIFHKHILSYTAGSGAREGSGTLAMAEFLAFNRQCLGDIGGFDGIAKLPPQARAYIQFFHKNFHLYRNVDNVADVALLYSEPSMAWNNEEPPVSFMLASQMLIQSRIPFDIIFEQHLQDLSKYKVLFLADQECLSDRQLEQIRSFVRNGGGLVATEDSSLYNEHRRRRSDFGLKDCFGISAAETAEARSAAMKAGPQRKAFGKGRVAYLPMIEPAVRKPPAAPMLHQYWKLPRNQPEILAATRWAMGGPFSIEAAESTSPYVVMELLQQKNENRLTLHAVNYDCARNPSLQNIAVSVAVPGREVKSVQFLTPDGPSSRPLKFRKEGSAVRFVLPSLNTYSMAVIEVG